MITSAVTEYQTMKRLVSEPASTVTTDDASSESVRPLSAQTVSSILQIPLC